MRQAESQSSGVQEKIDRIRRENYAQAKKLSDDKIQLADRLIEELQVLIARTRFHSNFARVRDHLEDAHAHLIRIREGL